MAFNPNYLSQRDPQWNDVKLGFEKTITIGTHGCALTCLAMLVNGFGLNETPKTLNKKLKELGAGNGFLGGLVVWSGLTRAFPKIAFENIIICHDQPAPIDVVDASLHAGQPVIIEVNRSLAQGLRNHWVILYKKQNIDYLMLDPWPYPSDNKEIYLNTRYGFGYEPKDIITAVVWYKSALPESMPAITLPVSAEGICVLVQTDLTLGLRLRTAPTTNSNTITIEPAGTLLNVLEAESTAKPKIGVYDQWLRVSDPLGYEGYVAAWYVLLLEETLSPQEPLPTPPSPEDTIPSPENGEIPQPQPSKMNVYVSSSVGKDGLRLRAHPSRTGALVTVLKAGAELTVLEAEDAARAKIGVQNQWLNVRNKKRNTGYVSARHVELPPAESAPSGETITGTLEGDLEETVTVRVSSLVGSSSLKMRDQPSITANTIRALAAGTPLQVLEPADMVPEKIGIFGKWLNVRDPQGYEGFVAAWYVEIEKTPELSPETEPESQTENLVVFVSMNIAANGLHLRAKPSVAGKSLTILKAGNRLTVLEPAEASYTKIGVRGKWLNVRDDKGNAGYVAAEYIELSPEDATAPGEASPDAPAGSVLEIPTVYVSSLVGSSNLRMREQPSKVANTIKLLPAGTPLQVLEPAEAALEKIGIYGCWLYVRDLNDDEGYVAGWYIQR